MTVQLKLHCHRTISKGVPKGGGGCLGALAPINRNDLYTESLKKITCRISAEKCMDVVVQVVLSMNYQNDLVYFFNGTFFI